MNFSNKSNSLCLIEHLASSSSMERILNFDQIACTYILPITSSVCLLSTATSLIIFIFGKEVKGEQFFYFRVKTIAEMIFVLFVLLQATDFVHTDSNVGHLIINIIYLYGTCGLHNIILIFLGFMELLIVYDRYIAVKADSKLNLKINKWIFIGIFLAISIALNLPLIIQYKIVLFENNVTSHYAIALIGFRIDILDILYYYSIVYAVVSSCIHAVLLPVAGFALVMAFRKFIDKKNELTNNQTNNNSNLNVLTIDRFNAKKNLTSMVLVLTSVFLISRFIYIFSICLDVYCSKNNFDISRFSIYLNFFSHEFNFSVTIGANMFIYFKFNRAFRKSFLSLFRWDDR
jgi:hypothetical protein